MAFSHLFTRGNARPNPRKCYREYRPGHKCQEPSDTETDMETQKEPTKDTAVETDSLDEGNATPKTVDGEVVSTTKQNKKARPTIHFILEEGQTFQDAHNAVAETRPYEVVKTYPSTLKKTGQQAIGMQLPDEKTAHQNELHYLATPMTVNGTTLYLQRLEGNRSTTDTDNMEEEEERRKRKLVPGSPYKKKRRDQWKNIEH